MRTKGDWGEGRIGVRARGDGGEGRTGVRAGLG